MAEASPVGPTMRALGDLRIDVAKLDIPLSEPEHPLAVRAQAFPEMVAANTAERIPSLTGRVWVNVKTGAWRGAEGNVLPLNWRYCALNDARYHPQREVSSGGCGCSRSAGTAHGMFERNNWRAADSVFVDERRARSVSNGS